MIMWQSFVAYSNTLSHCNLCSFYSGSSHLTHFIVLLNFLLTSHMRSFVFKSERLFSSSKFLENSLFKISTDVDAAIWSYFFLFEWHSFHIFVIFSLTILFHSPLLYSSTFFTSNSISHPFLETSLYHPPSVSTYLAGFSMTF